MPISVDSKKWGPDYVQGVSPSNPKHGMTWYDTTENHLKTYNGNTSSWVNTPAIVYQGIEYGYNMGGNNTGVSYSSIDRILFPFDSGTASNVGSLNQNIINQASCNSTNYAFCLGGYGYTAADNLSSIERFQFPLDSGSASIVGNLNNSARYKQGFNSSIHGYATGGNNGTIRSYMDRILFPFNSGTSTNIGILTNSRQLSASCNCTNYGFTMAGYDGVVRVSTVDRILFPHDSGTASNVGNLSSIRNSTPGCNSTNYGFTMAGHNTTGWQSTIDRMTFPFDSGNASHVGNVTGTRYLAAACNSTNHGFCLGGYPVSTVISIIERIVFPFDSGTASNVGNLSASKSSSAGIDGVDFASQFV